MSCKGDKINMNEFESERQAPRDNVRFFFCCIGSES